MKKNRSRVRERTAPTHAAFYEALNASTGAFARYFSWTLGGRELEQATGFLLASLKYEPCASGEEAIAAAGSIAGTAPREGSRV
jgi:hypothetical protein